MKSEDFASLSTKLFLVFSGTAVPKYRKLEEFNFRFFGSSVLLLCCTFGPKLVLIVSHWEVNNQNTSVLFNCQTFFIAIFRSKKLAFLRFEETPVKKTSLIFHLYYRKIRVTFSTLFFRTTEPKFL